MITQTNLALKKLKGIKPKGVKVKLVSSILDKLLYASDICVENFKDHNPSGSHSPAKGAFDLMSRLVKYDLLKDVNFDEDNLRDFILSRTNFDGTDKESLMLGCYSSVLFNMLYDKNKKENKPNCFYVNGGGNKFDYLFTAIPNSDVLIIENFSGDRILGTTVHKISKANIIICRDIVGSHLCESLGGGKLNLQMLIGENFKGKYGFCGVCPSIKQPHMVIGKNFFGDVNFSTLGFVGECGFLSIENVENINYLGASTGFLMNKGLKRLLYRDVFEPEFLEQAKVKYKLSPDINEELYLKERQKYRIDDILNLTNQTRNKSQTEIIEITNQMKNISDQIKHLL